MALSAQRIALQFQFITMRIMTVATADTIGMHLRLQKRTVNIHLVLYLAIGKIQARSEQGKVVIIVIVTADGWAGCAQRFPARVTGNLPEPTYYLAFDAVFRDACDVIVPVRPTP